MDEDESGGQFLVSVDELGATGLWSAVREILESRCTLTNLTFHNKLGRAVPVERLSLQFVASSDKRLQRLRPFAHSPVVWFRHPYAHVLLVCTAEPSDYKQTIKPALRAAIAELERDWGGPPVPGGPPPQPSGMGALLGGGGGGAGAQGAGVLGAEWLIVYVRPPDLEQADKGAKKVYDKLKDDFSPKGRNRVVRIDPPRGYPSSPAAAAAAAAAGVTLSSAGGAAAGGGGGGGWGGASTPRGSAGPAFMVPSGGLLGLDELDVCLRECVRASFEARQAAYMAEVQRLANERRDPAWSFASLYLVKDSLALLLEGCGMHLDAYKEYVELEAAYVETLDRPGAQKGVGQGQGQEQGGAAEEDDKYGACGEGAEVATLTSASWRVTRRSVLKRSAVQEFRFRQYLFASQSRLLLRMGRPVDVAERGLRFVAAVGEQLAEREEAGAGVRPLFKEAWTFSACMALIAAVTAAVFGRQVAEPAVQQTQQPQQQQQQQQQIAGHKRSATGGGWDTEAEASPGQRGAADAVADGGAEPSDPAAAASSGAGRCQAPVPGPVDWQLCLPFEVEVPVLDPLSLAGQAITPAALAASKPTDTEAQQRQTIHQAYMLALAQLYNAARCALLRLACRAARMAAEGSAGSGSGASGALGGEGPAEEARQQQLEAWQQELGDLAAHYPCRGVVGQFVDQEEDRQFEATPQQQASPLELLRQAMLRPREGGGAAGGAAGVAGTPRGDGNTAVASTSVNLTPAGASGPSEHWSYGPTQGRHGRSESMYNVSFAAMAGAAGGDAWEAASTGGRLGSSHGMAGPGGVAAGGGERGAGPAGGGGGGVGAGHHRSKLSWHADATMVSMGSGGAAVGAGGGLHHLRGRHHHSSSADNATSFFSKLDILASKVSSVLDPLKPGLRNSQATTAALPAKLPSPRAVEAQVADTSLGMDSIHAVRAAVHAARAMAAAGEGPLSTASSADPPTHPGPHHAHGHSAALAPGTEGPGGAAPPPPGCLPPEVDWLRDWRLRTALGSPRHCADLALQLALAAAACYGRSGRQRSAAQLYGDVGSVLLVRGQAEVAAELMEHVAALAQAEGWPVLLGRALPVLLAAQQAVGHVMTPFTCIKYLSLPPLVCQPGMRQRVLEHLLVHAGVAAGQAAGPGGKGPAGGRSRRLLQPTAVLQLGTMQAVQAAVLPGWASRFYGTAAGNGRPSLVPPARPAPLPAPYSSSASSTATATIATLTAFGSRTDTRQAGGDGAAEGGEGPGGGNAAASLRNAAGSPGAAQLVRVGEVCTLQVRVWSNLPSPVPLVDLHLVLGSLQHTGTAGGAGAGAGAGGGGANASSAPTGPHIHQHHRSSHVVSGGVQAGANAAAASAPSQSFLGAHGSAPLGAATWGPGGMPQRRSSTGHGSRPEPSVQQQQQAVGPERRSYVQQQGTTGPGGAHHAPSAPSLLHPNTHVYPSSPALGPTGPGSTAVAVGAGRPSTGPGTGAGGARGGVGGGGAAAVLDRNGTASSSSSLSLGPGAGPTGAAGASYTNLSEVSGMGARRAPSWPEGLSAVASMTGGAALGGGGGTFAGPPRPTVAPSSPFSAGSSVAGAPTTRRPGATLSGPAPPSDTSQGDAGSSSSAADRLFSGGGGGGGGDRPSSSGTPEARGGGGGRGRGSGWAPGDDLPCFHLTSVNHDPASARYLTLSLPPSRRETESGGVPSASASPRPSPRPDLEPAGPSFGAAAAPPATPPTTTTPSTAPSDPRVTLLQPGATTLTFQVAPMRPGLYYARHLVATLGSYELRIPLVGARALAAETRALAGGWEGMLDAGAAGVAGGGGGGGLAGGLGAFPFGGLLGAGGLGGGTAAALARLGRVMPDGDVCGVEVVLEVTPLLPRLMVGPVAVRGALSCGLPQWLGIALAPLEPPGPQPQDPGAAGQAAGGGGSGGGGGGAGAAKGAAAGEEGVQSGGLQFARVHVQSRKPSLLRIGDWPSLPSPTPAPLSALPSYVASTGGAAAPDPYDTPPAIHPTATALAPTNSSGAGVFGFAAAAAAAAAAPGHVSPLPFSTSVVRRPEAGATCRVAVVDLKRAAAVSEAVAAGSVPPTPAPASARLALRSIASMNVRRSSAGGAGVWGGRSTGGGAATGAGGAGAATAAAAAAGAAAAASTTWTFMTRQGVDLSQAMSGRPLRSPVLLWLPVWVPPAAVAGGDKGAALGVPPEVVRVQQAGGGPHVPGGGGEAPKSQPGQGQPGPPMALGPQSTGRRPLPPLELEVVVEGLQGGVWRSHATALSVPLTTPLSVHTRAHALPDGRVLVSCAATACLALPLLVTDVALEPQLGLVLNGGGAGPGAGAAGDGRGEGGGGGAGQNLAGAVPGLLPLWLAPGATANWAFVLERSADAFPLAPPLTGGGDDVCVLHVAYAVAPPGGDVGRPLEGEEVLGPALQPVCGHRYPLPALAAQGGPGATVTGEVLPALDSAFWGPGSGAGMPPISPTPPLQRCVTSNATCAAAAAQAAAGGGGGAAGPTLNYYSHTGAFGPAAVNWGSSGGGALLSAMPSGVPPLTPTMRVSGGGAAAAAAAAVTATGGAGVQTFSHAFTLEFPPSSAVTHNLVSVRLLGPHTASVGQPTTLTWLVTRVSALPPGSAAAAGGGGGGGAVGTPPGSALAAGGGRPSVSAMCEVGGGRSSSGVVPAFDDAGVDVAVYEVLGAEEVEGAGHQRATGMSLAGGTGGGGPGGRVWRRGVGCRGSVRLGRSRGSVAVVEAVVVPLAGGLVRAPGLRLQGLREVRLEAEAEAAKREEELVYVC